MPTRRINFILICLLFFAAIIVSRLFYLQIIKGNFYKAWAQGLYTKDSEMVAERGEIFFKNGQPLAINIDWPLVFASPGEMNEGEKDEAADKLAEILSLDKDVVLKKLGKKSLYEVLKKKVNQEEIERIKELNIKGISLGKERGRYYPQETLASQVVGFLDADLKGQYGLEGYYDKILQGKGNKKGEDLFLTIDYSLQFKAEKLLEKANQNLEIEGGEIIVLDPYSGEILALANFPTFNPNQYFNVPNLEVFKNGATQELFEPGSVFKPITMVAALTEEKITPQTTYFDEGVIKVGGWPIYNYDNRIWGERTMTEVLEKSINTGIVFAEQQLGHNLFLKYFENFGFFKPTGVDLKEAYSINREFKEGREINFVTASFGQGIEMTPLQLLKAYTVIANGGELVTPFVVKKEKEEEIKEPIVSTKATTQLITMLISVVENGYAQGAKIPGYYIAGKTGTAQVSYASLGINKRGYSEKTWQSFVGFFPALKPRFLILVKLDNPKAKTAEYSAVPLFQELARFIIDYYQLPPDY